MWRKGVRVPGHPGEGVCFPPLRRADSGAFAQPPGKVPRSQMPKTSAKFPFSAPQEGASLCHWFPWKRSPEPPPPLRALAHPSPFVCVCVCLHQPISSNFQVLGGRSREQLTHRGRRSLDCLGLTPGRDSVDPGADHGSALGRGECKPPAAVGSGQRLSSLRAWRAGDLGSLAPCQAR